MKYFVTYKQKDDVTYMNSKELIEKGTELVYSEKFGREVNYNFSSVHIPVEIYDGSEYLQGMTLVLNCLLNHLCSVASSC